MSCDVTGQQCHPDRPQGVLPKSIDPTKKRKHAVHKVEGDGVPLGDVSVAKKRKTGLASSADEVPGQPNDDKITTAIARYCTSDPIDPDDRKF